MTSQQSLVLQYRVMHVAFVGTGLAPIAMNSGALERINVQWIRGLRQLGHTVTVIKWESDATLRTRAEVEKLESLLKEVHANVYVMNNRPLWATLVDHPVLQVLHNFPDAWGIPDASTVTNGFAPNNQHFAAVSNALSEEVSSRLGQTCYTITVPVENIFFRKCWQPEPGLILFPNRLMYKKGVTVAIEAAKLLGNDWTFVFFDHIAPAREPTSEHIALRSAVKASSNSILVKSPSTRDEMANWFARSQVAICPSVQPEGLGLAALEAQAVGVPVVATREGGLSEAVLPPNSFIPTNDPQELADAIVRAANEFHGDRARQWVKQRYRVGPASLSLLGILERIAA